MTPTYTATFADSHSPLVRNEIWTNFSYLWPALLDLPQPHVGIHSRQDKIYYLIDLPSWQHAGKVFNERLQKNPAVLREALALSEQWGQELNQFTEQRVAAADLTQLSGEELHVIYRSFASLQSRQYAVGIQLSLMDLSSPPFLDEFLRGHLESRLPKTEVEQAFGAFMTPVRNSFGADQEEELLRLAAACQTDPACWDMLKSAEPGTIPTRLSELSPNLAEALKQHAQEFGWIYYVYAGPAFTVAQFAGFLQDIARKHPSPKEELQRLERERQQLLETREHYLNLLQLDDPTREFLLFLSDFAWAKPRRKDYQSRSYSHMEKFYQEWGRRTHVPLLLARSATSAQIAAGLAGEAVDKDALESQYQEHVVHDGPEGATLLMGEAAERFLARQVVAAPKTVRETHKLRGAIAFPGFAQGIVKIINRPEDMAKMEPGDILVAVATAPSIVPAMKQAAAIISDEGGLTCHAAIVSRELKTPCIVGTRIATKLLKDGDKIDVDANRGIIRIPYASPATPYAR